MKNTSKTTLDKIFSEYIRRRDSDKYGYIRCISCGKVVRWQDSDCGHYVNRGHNSTRYDELNCNAQCRKCNRFDEGNIYNYRKGLIKKYSEQIVELIEIKKHNHCKLGQFEINVLAEEYRRKLKEIKKQSK